MSIDADDPIGRALRDERPIEPSPAFASRVMRQVRAAPPPRRVPVAGWTFPWTFPWTGLGLGIAAAAGLWLLGEIPPAPGPPLMPMGPAAGEPGVEPIHLLIHWLSLVGAGTVALAGWASTVLARVH